MSLWRGKWRLAATRTESGGNFFFSGAAPLTTFPFKAGSGVGVTLVTAQCEHASLHLELIQVHTSDRSL